MPQLEGGAGSGPDRAPIDFVGLAASLLDRASTLVPQWLPAGTRKGAYWVCGDFDGGEGKSAHVHLGKGVWMDHAAPDDKGGDLLSLYKRVFRHATMLAAARELMGDTGWRAAPVAPPKKERAADWIAVRPVPDDAPDYRTQWGHFARGVPPMHWEYRDRDGRLLGVVARFNASDGTKDVQPLSWCQGPKNRRQWRYKAFAAPRPLYGLQRLGPSGQAVPRSVIVVEGEKKADALWEFLGRAVPVLSWPGGCRAVGLADWSALDEGTEVLCWPDADSQRDKKSGELLPAHKQPGLAAMLAVRELLDRQGCVVRIVDVGPPGTRPDGWDAADAIAEGWTREQVHELMARTMAGPAPPASAARPVAGGGGGSSPPTGAAQGTVGEPPPPGPRDPRWIDQLVYDGRKVANCVANVMLVLHEHELWQGVLAFDEFGQRVVKRRAAPYEADSAAMPAEWSDVDDTRAAAWLSRRYGGMGFIPASAVVAEAANEAARAAAYHPVLDWLRTLSHDGTVRIDHWLVDYLGVKDTEYTRLVSRWFLIGMCRRVIEPGCKFDTCLVLEGPQGRKKSSALRVLAGEWFSDTELDLQHKDSMSYIRGKWLHEVAELGSLMRAEETRQKSFLSRQVDEFRPTYGRREIRSPRQVAFGATTNQWQWNKDPTGGRRFWPVEVGEEIDLDGLASVREQLFAEAYALALQRERYWPEPEQQRELFDPEQLAREAPEAFVDLLGAWLNSATGSMKEEFSLAEACMEGLKLDARALTRDVQTRVGIALHKLGCARVERRNAVHRFAYRRPDRKAASSIAGAAGSEEGEVPF